MMRIYSSDIYEYETTITIMRYRHENSSKLMSIVIIFEDHSHNSNAAHILFIKITVILNIVSIFIHYYIINFFFHLITVRGSSNILWLCPVSRFDDCRANTMDFSIASICCLLLNYSRIQVHTRTHLI